MTSRRESVFDGSVAAIAGAAACYCAWLLAPVGAWPVAAASGLGIAFAVSKLMRALERPAAPYDASLAAAFPPFEDALLLDETVDDAMPAMREERAPGVADVQARIASAFDALQQVDSQDGPLELEDALVVQEEDNRVVALFGGERARSTSPGELKARIDAHLADEDVQPLAPLPPDASEALSAALQSLRRPD